MFLLPFYLKLLSHPLHHLLAPALEVLCKVLVELLGEAFASADAVVVVNPRGCSVCGRLGVQT